jgi:hypothetical protein
MKRMLSLLAVVLIAACSAHPTTHAAPSPSAEASPSSSSTAASGPSTPPVPSQCSDNDLTVTAGEVASANTLRRVGVSFKNTSSHPCTLTGYPGADLVTAAGGVLVHVGRRPAAAAHRLTLGPGELANADVQAYAIDTATGNSCPRIGTLVVTPPNGFVSHMLEANLPICGATISSVD